MISGVAQIANLRKESQRKGILRGADPGFDLKKKPLI
jgi:hypothetical protein